MSDGGYWVDSPDNPFNQMSYTRGGGGYDNSSTHESNAARAHAMQGAGASALPHYATAAVAQSVLPAGSLAVVGNNVIRTGAAAAPVTTGPGAPSAVTQDRVRTKGPGSQLTISAAPLKTKTKTEATKLEVGGVPWEPNPWWSDTEEFEARYGEPGDWVGGVVVFTADVFHNAREAAKRVAAEGYVPLKQVPESMEWVTAPSLPTLTLTPTPEADLPSPMQFAPMSAW